MEAIILLKNLIEEEINTVYLRPFDKNYLTEKRMREIKEIKENLDYGYRTEIYKLYSNL